MSDEIHIDVAPDFAVDCSQLRRAAAIVLQQHRCESCGLSIAVTDDDRVRDLNLKHRHINAATDVLSFPAALMPSELQLRGEYLGDIVIAYPYTQERARQTTTNFQHVLCLLVVHGTLHLLGYDHNDSEAHKTMWSAQDAALRSLRIDPGLADRYGGPILG